MLLVVVVLFCRLKMPSLARNSELIRFFLSSYQDRASRSKKRKQSGASTAGSPPKPKRAHTGYTLFVLENYETIKSAHTVGAKEGDAVMNSKDVLATLARHWNQVDEQEKRAWQEKADQLKMAAAAEEAATEVADGSAAALPPEVFEEMELPEPPNEDWGNKKRPARKAPVEDLDAAAAAVHHV